LVALFCLPKYPKQEKEIKMKIKLYNSKYRKDILGLARSSNVPGLTWEDVMQELEIILWRKLPDYRGDNGAKERTFAITIMKNRIRDLFRSTTRQKRVLNSMCLPFSEVDQILEGDYALVNAKSIFDYEK